MQKKNHNSLHRLFEIIQILRKHHLSQGIDPVKLRMILEDLGPTFVKIGQIMASRQDMFSERYCQELVKLRDNVIPMTLDDVVDVIESEYHQPLHEIFQSFDEKPLGSASIAQVHKAILKDQRQIVVKVQRPHIYQMMERDIALVRKAIRLLRINEVLGSVVDLNIVLDEFWHTAQEEMDFLNEAQFAKRFHKFNEDYCYIGTPYIVDEYTTSRVLVMEYVEGYEIDQFVLLEKEGYDRKEIAAKLAENYIKQIVDDGFFHADPHPGNLRIRDGQIVWIDFGMMGILNHEDKDLMKRAVIAIGKNNAQQLVDVILELGQHDGHMDYPMLYNDIETFMHHYINMNLNEINLGHAMQEIFTIAHKHKISMPKGISMLARGLVTIESTVMLIDPHLSIIEIATHHVSSHTIKQNDAQKLLKHTTQKLFDAADHMLNIPVQLSEIMRMMMKGYLKVNLNLMDSSVPLSKLNHMVNKITVGIVSAGLLMASSLLCTTQMSPQILGIPALGFIGYITAVGLGIWLLFSVIYEKRSQK